MLLIFTKFFTIVLASTVTGTQSHTCHVAGRQQHEYHEIKQLIRVTRAASVIETKNAFMANGNSNSRNL